MIPVAEVAPGVSVVKPSRKDLPDPNPPSIEEFPIITEHAKISHHPLPKLSLFIIYTGRCFY
jgi:hypothetical protein